MAIVTTPHFDLPFRIASDGHVAVVEQNTDKDIQNCVEAIVRTPQGFRPFVPDFGIEDPAFMNEPLDTVLIETQITKNEPRAAIQLDQRIDTYDDLITYLTVEVG